MSKPKDAQCSRTQSIAVYFRNRTNMITVKPTDAHDWLELSASGRAAQWAEWRNGKNKITFYGTFESSVGNNIM